MVEGLGFRVKLWFKVKGRGDLENLRKTATNLNPKPYQL